MKDTIGFITYPESSHEISDVDRLQTYITSGQGVITLENPETSVHKTYAFNDPRHKDRFTDGTIFIYYHSSSGYWLYVGMLRYGNIRVTKASNFYSDNPVYLGAKYIVDVANNRRRNTKMKIYHCGMCCVCGRKLTSPRSILEGIGPRCKRNKQKLADIQDVKS